MCRIGLSALSKLLQESHVPLKEQLQIIKPILQHRNSINAHAKGETGNLFGIVAVVLHKLEDVGIDHAAAENLDPSGLLAGSAGAPFTLPASAADEAGDEHLRARLGERKKRWTKAGLHIRAEQCFHRVIKGPLEVAEGNVRIDGESFDLVKHRRMACVGRIIAV